MDSQGNLSLSGFGAQCSVINAMRTGNPFLDVLLAMLVPFIWQKAGSLTDFLKAVLAFLLRRVQRKPKVERHIRRVSIRHPSVIQGSLTMDVEDKNHFMVKAIRFYIEAHYKNSTPVQDVFLLPTKPPQLEPTQRRVPPQLHQHYKMQALNSVSQTQSTGKYLDCCEITRLPDENEVLQLGSKPNELTFKQYKKEISGNNETGKPYECQLTYEFVAHGANGAELIDCWLDNVFEWYRKQRASDDQSAHTRYFLQAMEPKITDTSATNPASLARSPLRPPLPGSLHYRRYALSDDKTFQCLFFPEKESLLKLIDEFLQRQGKFGIPGFPNKLGLLLDGPPGSGKTSLIKALAAYTKRHIVSISLHKIASNEQLMDIMYDLVFPVPGHEDGGYRLTMEDIVFVMEDIDCASNVVYARKGPREHSGAEASASVASTLVDAPWDPELIVSPVAGQSPTTPILRRSMTEPGHLRTGEIHEAILTKLRKQVLPRKNVSQPKAPTLKLKREQQSKDADEVDNDGNVSGSDLSWADNDIEPRSLLRWLKKLDGDAAKHDPFVGMFNLAGLLNILDGVVDSPGRILVMTTNHPEKLDPALIRPGRINKRIRLGYVSESSFCDMATHYLQCSMTTAERKEARSLVNNRLITPAFVEQCCADVDSMRELLDRLSS